MSLSKYIVKLNYKLSGFLNTHRSILFQFYTYAAFQFLHDLLNVYIRGYQNEARMCEASYLKTENK
jgi:hypothetical protein